MPRDWLPGLPWVHWTGIHLALAPSSHILVRVWVCDYVALFDLCARLQAVVQEVWELYFSGLAACLG